MVKAYAAMRDAVVSGKDANADIIDLVNQIPHRTYRDGFLLNELKDFPEREEPIRHSKNPSKEERICSTTLDSA